MKTRITFKTTVKGEGEKAPDRKFSVVVDSPLINKYSQIYEDVIEVNDEDVKDEASLRKYGEQYFKTSLCDMMEDSLELEVVGQSDVPVQIYDIVSLFYEIYNLDVRKKITKYTYSPMAKKLKSIGFGQFQSGLANAIGNAVSDAVKGEAQQLQDDFERQLARELKNADLAFDRQKEELVNQFTDGLNAAKARAEEVKQELSDTIDQRFSSFDNGPLQEVKRRAEEALRNAGASTLLAQEAKRIGLDSVAKLEEFKRQATSAQTALLGDLDVLKRTIANDIRPKQAQAEAEISKQVEALVQTKKELAGVKSAQSTFEQSTTRRLSELTNLANGKASKSELTQTAEELTSKIASVQVAHRNQGDRVSAIESNFKQRADALDAGVNRLTEGLRTKADISSLNVTAENIRQSVKSLETNTQNKLNQKLSLAEFEVRAGSIRQEILNATKDKADKTLVISEAGKIREEFSKMKVGGRNYAEDYDFSRSLWQYSQGDSSPQDWTILNGEYNVKGTTNTWKQMQIYSKEGSRASSKSSTALLDLEIGETYTLSFQGICYSGSPNVWVSLRANRTAPGNPEIMNGNFTLTSSWQTYQVTIPALTKPDNFDFWRIILGYNEIGHVAFRKVELTRSSTRIDAGPAPEDGKTDLVVAKSEFQRTADGLSAKLAAVESYIGQDSQRQEALQRYTREESAKQATSVRELVNREFVGKSTYQEDVRGLERRFSAISTQTNNDIASKIAQYKQTVDGRFADITSLLTGKANQADFQRVKETSQLYERIIGSNENDISNKVARMALTNQLFQVEVSKYAGNGVNRALNTTSDWGPFISRSGTDGVNLHADLHKILSSGFKAGDTVHIRMEISIDGVQRFNDKQIVAILQSYGDVTNWSRAGRTFDYNIGTLQPGNNWRLIEFNTVMTEEILKNNSWMLNIRVDGASSYKVHTKSVKVEKGNVASAWSPAPEDTDEAIRSVQSQIAGSWSIQNLTSAGSIVSQINATNNQILIEAEKIRLKGKTLLDELTAIQGYFKRLFVGEGTFATLNADIIRTNSITADKLVFNEALANRLVSNEIITSKLVASRAFVNALRAVTIDASQIVTGTLKGDRIYGGTIRGTEINGTTITGNSRMTIGDNGFLRPTQEGGLQINVPETYSASKGVSVQLLGRELGRIPKGMFIYNSPNWNGGNIIGDNTEDILLTVKGRVSLCNLHNGSPVSGVPIISNFEYQNPIRNLYPIRFIGWDPRSNQLYVDDGTGKSGTWWISVDGSTSDKNLKTNIGDTHYNALDFVQKLMFKEFDWKTDKFGYKKPYTNVGLIAQDVEKIDSSLVYKKGETLALDDFRLLNIALKAIQELALENRKLTHRLENLENERRTA